MMHKSRSLHITKHYFLATVASLFCAAFMAEHAIAKEWRGRVLSPEGLPLSQAEVHVNHGLRRVHYYEGKRRSPTLIETLQTNEHGEFSCKSAILLEASHADWPGYKASLPLGLSITDYKVLVLQKTLTIKGRILNRESRPIDGARITLEHHVGPFAAAPIWSEYVTLQSVSSKHDGSYTFDGLVPGNRYRLVVYAEGYVRFVTDLIYASSYGLRRFDRIRMTPGQDVTFSVLSPDGQAVPNAQVRVIEFRELDWFHASGHTNKTGKVTLEDLPSGRISVDVRLEKDPNAKWEQDKRWYQPGGEGIVCIRLKNKESATRRETHDQKLVK